MQEINCPFIINGIHFFYKYIKACSANVPGPILLDNYKGEKIDWDALLEKRKAIKQRFMNGELPASCTNCFAVEEFKNKKETNDSTQINAVYISHWLHCNCNCTYCVRNCFIDNKFDKNVKKSKYYDLYPILKEMVEKKILAPGAFVCVTGGEPTVLKELDKVLDLLLSYIEIPIMIFSSGIRFNKGIEKCFKKNKCNLVVSVDSGTKETYEKIKRVRCFDDFKKTIKKYVASAPSAGENITLKYILLKGVNDNLEEIEKWLLLTKDLKVKNIRLDVDCKINLEEEANNIPPHYFEIYNHINNRAKELDLNIVFAEQIGKILEKGYVF